MIIQNHYTRQCFAVPKFFASWNDCYCFDRSGLHSSTRLQNIVDTTRKTEKEMRSSHHDGYGEQHDREISSSLLWHLVADTVDCVDHASIKGGSLFLA